jgi:lipopolysaccharide transport system ATP-binding protein
VALKNMTLVELKNLSLSFPIYSLFQRSLKSTLINRSLGGLIKRQGQSALSIQALDQINFKLEPGDKFGIIGHNGSGKTSLLRVITGVYKNFTGEMLVNGSISSLIDISLGMDMEATGFENIRMRGVMMGLRLSEIKDLEDDIAAFSELGDYLNLPIRTYSSGMHMRLGFSISTAIKSQILIMDEWLSVGDESFQLRAEARLKTLLSEDSILILASQSRQLINSVCNKYIELEHGKIIKRGNGINVS